MIDCFNSPVDCSAHTSSLISKVEIFIKFSTHSKEFLEYLWTEMIVARKIFQHKQKKTFVHKFQPILLCDEEIPQPPQKLNDSRNARRFL